MLPVPVRGTTFDYRRGTAEGHCPPSKVSGIRQEYSQRGDIKHVKLPPCFLIVLTEGMAK